MVFLKAVERAETKRLNSVVFFLMLSTPLLTDVRSQEPSGFHPLEPSDTSTPAATLNSLIRSWNELDQLIEIGPVTEDRANEILPTTERILDCLDLRKLPEELRSTAGIHAALFLKEVLERTPLPPDDEIPKPSEAEVTETLGWWIPKTRVLIARPQEGSSGVAKLERWQVPNTQVSIARIQEGPRRGDFLFTSGTVARAPDLYEKLASQPYREGGRPVSKGFHKWWLSNPGNPMVGRLVDRTTRLPRR